MAKNRYQNSECKNGYLHDYLSVREYPKGVLERCTRCGKQMFFPHQVPNHVYISHHIKSALQPYDPRFKREYPNFKK